jgi:hypothetical protein
MYKESIMYQYSDIEYDYQVMIDFIEKEMHNTRKDALLKLSSMVVTSNDNVESVANILAYGYFDNHPDAEKLAQQLDLCKMDFLAIQEELDAFKEEYLKLVF